MSPLRSVFPVTPVGPAQSHSPLIRYVLLAITVLSLLFSVVFGAIGIVVLGKIGSVMTPLQQTSVWFHVFIYIIFGMFCFLGIYACTLKKTSAASLYTSLVIGEILFCIGSGVLSLYLLFDKTSSQSWNVDKCLSVAFDQFTRELCLKTNLLKGFTVAMFIVMWLVQIAIIFLGNNFLTQLQDEAVRSGTSPPKYDRDGDDC